MQAAANRDLYRQLASHARGPKDEDVLTAHQLCTIGQPESQAVNFTYELSVATLHGHTSDGSFDIALNSPTAPQGKALPAEALPGDIEFAGIHFQLAPAGIGRPNATTGHGQAIALPAGNFNRIYLLAAARAGDQNATFRVADKLVELNIQEWTAYVGQWDNRVWRPREEQIQHPPGEQLRLGEPHVRLNPYGDVLEIVPGFIKSADIAWYASHRHNSDGSSEPYQYSYLFAYPIDLPVGANTLILPNNDCIRILAITVATEHGTVHRCSRCTMCSRERRTDCVSDNSFSMALAASSCSGRATSQECDTSSRSRSISLKFGCSKQHRFTPAN